MVRLRRPVLLRPGWHRDLERLGSGWRDVLPGGEAASLPYEIQGAWRSLVTIGAEVSLLDLQVPEDEDAVKRILKEAQAWVRKDADPALAK